MAHYLKPPLSEMSIAVQFADRGVFAGRAAVDYYDGLRDSFPQLDLWTRLESLGTASNTIPSFGLEISPRWALASEAGETLLQLQDDLLALNWRRGDGSGISYPGFEVMHRSFAEHLNSWLPHAFPDHNPGVAACAVYYDNIWPIAAEATVGDVFAFWRTVGIKGHMAGPEVKWSIMLDPTVLGPNARIDLMSSIGTIGSERAARLTINAVAYPDQPDKLSEVIGELHSRAHEYFDRLITDTTKELWNV